MPLNLGDDKLGIDISIDSRGAIKGSKEVERALRGIQGETQKTNRAGQLLTRTFVALGGAFAIQRLGGSLLGTNAAFERYEITLRSVLGSQQLANQAFQDMVTLARDMPFELDNIARSFTRLAPTFGKNTQELRKLVEVAGGIGAIFNLDIAVAADQIARIGTAGVGSADRFREQGIISGLGLTGLSPQEAIAELLTAFDENRLGIKNATGELATTFDGLISMLGDAWTELERLFGELGLFDAAKSAISSLTDGIRYVNENFDKLVDSMDEFVIGLTGATLSLRALGSSSFVAGISNLVGSQGIIGGIKRGFATRQSTNKLASINPNLVPPNLATYSNIFAGAEGKLKGLIRIIGVFAADIGKLAVRISGPAGIVATLYAFRDSIRPVPGSIATLGDYMKVLGEEVEGVIDRMPNLIDAFSSFLGKLGDAIGDFITNIIPSGAQALFQNFARDVGDLWDEAMANVNFSIEPPGRARAEQIAANRLGLQNIGPHQLVGPPADLMEAIKENTDELGKVAEGFRRISKYTLPSQIAGPSPTLETQPQFGPLLGFRPRFPDFDPSAFGGQRSGAYQQDRINWQLEARQRQQAQNATLEGLRQENELLRLKQELSGTELEVAQIILESKKEGVVFNDEQIKQIGELIDANKELAKVMEFDAFQAASALGQALSLTFGQANEGLNRFIQDMERGIRIIEAFDRAGSFFGLEGSSGGGLLGDLIKGGIGALTGGFGGNIGFGSGQIGSFSTAGGQFVMHTGGKVSSDGLRNLEQGERVLSRAQNIRYEQEQMGGMGAKKLQVEVNVRNQGGEIEVVDKRESFNGEKLIVDVVTRNIKNRGIIQRSIDANQGKRVS